MLGERIFLKKRKALEDTFMEMQLLMTKKKQRGFKTCSSFNLVFMTQIKSQSHLRRFVRYVQMLIEVNLLKEKVKHN